MNGKISNCRSWGTFDRLDNRPNLTYNDMVYPREWWNWQTRKPQELVAARSWRFKSSLAHFTKTEDAAVTKDPKNPTPDEKAEEAQAVEAMRKSASKPDEPADKAQTVDAMRQAAEAPPRNLTPEEAAAEAEAARKYIEKFRPHPVDTPIYKPPA